MQVLLLSFRGSLSLVVVTRSPPLPCCSCFHDEHDVWTHLVIEAVDGLSVAALCFVSSLGHAVRQHAAQHA